MARNLAYNSTWAALQRDVPLATQLVQSLTDPLSSDTDVVMVAIRLKSGERLASGPAGITPADLIPLPAPALVRESVRLAHPRLGPLLVFRQPIVTDLAPGETLDPNKPPDSHGPPRPVAGVDVAFRDVDASLVPAVVLSMGALAIAIALVAAGSTRRTG